MSAEASPWWTLVSPSPHAGAATLADSSFSAMLDVNGDGLGDLVAGAPDAASGGATLVGFARVHHGNTLAAGGAFAQRYTLESPRMGAGTRFGWSAANAGDLNGDGYSDVAIGAPDVPVNGSGVPGFAAVYMGSPSGLQAASGTAIVIDSPDATTLGMFAETVAGVGDVNGDGYGDLAVGMPLAPVGPTLGVGQVTLFPGSDRGIRPSRTGRTNIPSPALTGAGFGWSISGGADFNGDGYADFAVGSPFLQVGSTTNVGQVNVFMGSRTGPATDPAVAVTLDSPAPSDGAQFGYALAALDINADGYSDLVVGMPSATVGGVSAVGRVAVYFGGSMGLRTSPVDRVVIDSPFAPAGGEFALSVASAGDVNGDGFADLVISRPSIRTGTASRLGQGIVMLGSASGLRADAGSLIVLSPTDRDGAQRLSYAAVGLGDTDGNGLSDLALGAPATADATGVSMGRAIVYPGRSDGPVADEFDVFVDPPPGIRQSGFASSLAGIR